MLSVRELFDLIKSLNKTERRYCRIGLEEKGAETAYFELYRRLEESPFFDADLELQLKERFNNHQLEITRKHLGKLLLRILNKYHLQTDRENLLWERYANAKLLLQKGFSNAGLRHIALGKAAAQEIGHTYFFSMFCRLELDHGTRQKFADWEEEQVVAVHESVREGMKEEEAAREHAALYEILLCRYWKNGVVRNFSQTARLNDIVLEEHQAVQNQRKETFRSGQLHLHFQSVYFMMTGDPDGSLKAFYALDDFFQAHRHEWMADPQSYIRFLQDVLETLRRFGRFEEMPHFTDRLNSLDVKSKYLKAKIVLLSAELNLHVNLALESRPDDIVIPVFPVAVLDQAPLQDVIQWWFTTARAYLFKKNHQESLSLVNRLLRLPAAELGAMNYSKIRMLNLMVHHAMQNRDYLFYEIRSFERKMKSGGTWHYTEKLVVDYLKHWLAYRPFARKMNAESLNDPYEQVMVSELGLRRWLKLG